MTNEYDYLKLDYKMPTNSGFYYDCEWYDNIPDALDAAWQKTIYDIYKSFLSEVDTDDNFELITKEEIDRLTLDSLTKQILWNLKREFLAQDIRRFLSEGNISKAKEYIDNYMKSFAASQLDDGDKSLEMTV